MSENKKWRDQRFAADKAYESASRAYFGALKRIFPVGCVVRVRIGRAMLYIRVSGYGSNHHDLGRIYGHNVTTGAMRGFHSNQILEIIEEIQEETNTVRDWYCKRCNDTWEASIDGACPRCGEGDQIADVTEEGSANG